MSETSAMRPARRRRAKWYAVQTVAGRERRACELLREAMGFASEACFVPLVRVGKKADSVWQAAEEPLMPGYFIVVANEPDAIAGALARVEGFARILKENNAFASLADGDVRWIAAQTGCGSYAMGMSEGYVQDGVLHVTSGPLLGKEAWVRKVNHRKKIAYVEFQAFGRTVKAQMGIRITRKRA